MLSIQYDSTSPAQLIPIRLNIFCYEKQAGAGLEITATAMVASRFDKQSRASKAKSNNDGSVANKFQRAIFFPPRDDRKRGCSFELSNLHVLASRFCPFFLRHYHNMMSSRAIRAP